MIRKLLEENCKSGKVYSIGLNNVVDEYGQATIRHKLEVKTGHYLPAGWDWHWLAIDGNYSGRLTKRVSSYYYKEYGVKLDNSLVSEIGVIAKDHMPEDMIIDFDNRFAWYDGDFGDDESCYWTCRTSVLSAMRESDTAFAIRRWSTKSVSFSDATGQIQSQIKRLELILQKAVNNQNLDLYTRCLCASCKMTRRMLEEEHDYLVNKLDAIVTSHKDKKGYDNIDPSIHVFGTARAWIALNSNDQMLTIYNIYPKGGDRKLVYAMVKWLTDQTGRDYSWSHVALRKSGESDNNVYINGDDNYGFLVKPKGLSTKDVFVIHLPYSTKGACCFCNRTILSHNDISTFASGRADKEIRIMKIEKDDVFCQTCLHERVAYCNICHEPVSSFDIHEKNRYAICDKCHKKKLARCDICGKEHSTVFDVFMPKNIVVNELILDNKLTICSDCGDKSADFLDCLVESQVRVMEVDQRIVDQFTEDINVI